VQLLFQKRVLNKLSNPVLTLLKLQYSASEHIRKEQGMKFPVLWLSFVSVWAGTGKVICLAWDLVSRSPIP